MEEHTTFCPACGAPQIKVSLPAEAAANPPASVPLPPGTPDFIQPPPFPVTLQPAGQIQWKRFWRIALPLIIISGVAVGLFGIFGIILFLVSLVIAISRYRREQNGTLTASQGGRLGAVMGLVSYLVVVIMVTVQVALRFADFRQQWLQNLQQRMGSNPDPQIQGFIHWAATDQGILVISLVSTIISAILVGVIAGLIGAVTASSGGSKRR